MEANITCKIGVLGVQGAFAEHRAALLRASRLLVAPVNLEVYDVRTATGITDDLDGFIIPGGESTVISMFLQRNNMDVPLKAWTKEPHHVTWGTCAGMILLAEKSVHQKEGGQPQIGGLDVVVSRNYFGRQVDSFEAEVQLAKVVFSRRVGESGDGANSTCPGVFIRAPVVTEVGGPDVQVLGTLQHSNQVVAVKQGNLMATAFHPELTEDPTWHLFFIQTVLSNKTRTNNTQSTS